MPDKNDPKHFFFEYEEDAKAAQPEDSRAQGTAEPLPTPEDPAPQADSFWERAKRFVADADEKSEAFLKKADQAADQFMGDADQWLKGAKEKAKDAHQQFREGVDSLEEKLRLREEAAEAADRERREKHKLSDSEVNKYDSFFEKAKDFAKGKDQVRVTQPDAPDKKKPQGPFEVHGFEDADGDGNPIIDDAIIDED